MAQILIGLLVIIAFIVVFVLFFYNTLVALRNRVKEAWSDIDVQLKRRSSLIPNLVNTVKGYMKHEKELLTKITELRSKIDSAKSPKELGVLNNQMSSALGSLNIAVENYPDLKASNNFKQLQEELTNTEDKISYSRRFYNQNVLSYNTAIQKFPGVLIAGPMGFTAEEFFEANEQERKDVEVNFDDKPSK